MAEKDKKQPMNFSNHILTETSDPTKDHQEDPQRWESNGSKIKLENPITINNYGDGPSSNVENLSPSQKHVNQNLPAANIAQSSRSINFVSTMRKNNIRFPYNYGKKIPAASTGRQMRVQKPANLGRLHKSRELIGLEKLDNGESKSKTAGFLKFN